MDRTRLYSAACSVTNSFVVLVLTASTWLIAIQWEPLQAVWRQIIIAIVGLILHSYVVQWWLSIPVNLAWRRIIVEKKNDSMHGRI